LISYFPPLFLKNMKKQQALELINDLIKRVDAVGEQAFTAGVFPDVSLVEDIFKTYKLIFNKEWKVTCKSCYFDCYTYLYGLTKNSKELEIMENKIYSLKKGILLQGFPFSADDKYTCTDKSITTEIAEWHLKVDP